MLIDIHELHPCGRVGKLLDTIDVPRPKTDNIEFEGKIYRMYAGVRNFILMTLEEWEEV